MSEELREGLAKAIRHFLEPAGVCLGMRTRQMLADACLDYIRQHDGWQPIETAPKMRKIIVTYKNELGKDRCVMACYYEANALEMNDDYADVGTYDEATGQSFAPAGWYEEVDHEGDVYALCGEPAHWKPLPAPPKEQNNG
jgi:hypothetical protein